MNVPSASHTLSSPSLWSGGRLRSEVDVEADVVRSLYGDPSSRRRAHNTRKRTEHTSAAPASSELPLAIVRARDGS